MEIIDLEMIPGGPKKTCHASQFDNGRVIRFNLKENGQPFALSGTETVQAIIRKPDGSETTLDIANTSSTYVDLITEADTCDIAGVNHCEMKVTEDGEDLGSGNFDMKVEEDAYGEAGVTVGTASGPIASFETDIKDDLIECKGDIGYRAAGYKQATFISSRTTPQKDTEPYLFRTSGGSLQNIGGQEHDTLVGGTVAWNQLYSKTDTVTGNGITFTNNNGKISLSGLATGDYYYTLNTNIPTGHKVLISGGNANSDNKTAYLYVANSGAYYNLMNGRTDTIFAVGATASIGISIKTYNGYNADNTPLAFTPQLFDLTQMFGSTIADYIYGLEQATAGAGVAWLKNHGFMTKPYYPYNAGELISVKTSAHIMRDAANNIIGNYALDSDLELRGIPKLINNRLVFDGDEYADNGAVERRYGIVDLGTLTWTKYTHSTFGTYFYTNINNLIKYVGIYQTNIYPVICHKYVTVARNENLTNGDKVLCIDGSINNVGQIQIKDSVYTDAAAFKASLSGIYLVFEKATPTAETAEPFTNPQAVSKYGTEEYIDGRTVEMPVGHSTIYGDDIQAKTATFPERIYGGSINLTTGELTSTKNADGTDKGTPDTYQLTPKNLEARSGQNNIMNDTNGDTAVKFYTRA